MIVLTCDAASATSDIAVKVDGGATSITALEDTVPITAIFAGDVLTLADGGTDGTANCQAVKIANSPDAL